jgi:uncharacterized metal-binding protein YceD (DUF177 family)
MVRREFEIAFVGLPQGVHQFEYLIDDKFFETYQEQEFKNCKAKVKITLEKGTSLLMLGFEVGGNLLSICDRCGNDFPITLWDDYKIIVKLVEDPEKMNAEEEDPDIYYIARTEGILHVKDWIYEFVNLTIPMQKMCTEEEMGGEKCNKEVLDMLKKINVNSIKVENNIWKDLDKFKDLDN